MGLTKQGVKFTPRVLFGSNGKPEGEEVYVCQICGVLVTERDMVKHGHWHQRKKDAKETDYAD